MKICSTDTKTVKDLKTGTVFRIDRYTYMKLTQSQTVLQAVWEVRGGYETTVSSKAEVDETYPNVCLHLHGCKRQGDSK